MGKGEDRICVSTVLPWFISLLIGLALIFVIVKQRSGDVSVFETVVRESEILSDMRLNLLRAAEAEKSAVLAVSNEESRKFADQARLASDGVDKDYKELARLIDGDNSVQESALVTEFGRCWKDLQKLDQSILDLAVQNTNIQASNLALTKGAEAVSRLEKSLNGFIGSSAPECANSKSVKLAYQALVAGIKIHDLFAAHIEAETDRQMDEIERSIGANEDVLKHSLNELNDLVKGKGLDTLKDATVAYGELTQVTKEILKLSRQNTNIKSLELSLGRKRLITAQCDEILRTLQDLVRGNANKATR